MLSLKSFVGTFELVVNMQKHYNKLKVQSYYM